MKLSKLKVLFALWLTLVSQMSFAQNPQNPGAPLYAVNAKYANGIAPGYAPTSGVGLSLLVGPGTVNCSGTMTTYAGGTFSLGANATTYVYLNTTSSCAPAIKTSIFNAYDIPIAVILTDGTKITSLIDDRTIFVPPSGLTVANQVVVSNGANLTTQITAGATNVVAGPGDYNAPSNINTAGLNFLCLGWMQCTMHFSAAQMIGINGGLGTAMNPGYFKWSMSGWILDFTGVSNGGLTMNDWLASTLAVTIHNATGNALMLKGSCITPGDPTTCANYPWPSSSTALDVIPYLNCDGNIGQCLVANGDDNVTCGQPQHTSGVVTDLTIGTITSGNNGASGGNINGPYGIQITSGFDTIKFGDVFLDMAVSGPTAGVIFNSRCGTTNGGVAAIDIGKLTIAATSPTINVIANSSDGIIHSYWPARNSIRTFTNTTWSGDGTTLIVQAAQNLTPGETIKYAASGGDGLIALNGLPFTVLRAGLSGTQYEISTALVSGSGSTSSTITAQSSWVGNGYDQWDVHYRSGDPFQTGIPTAIFNQTCNQINVGAANSATNTAYSTSGGNVIITGNNNFTTGIPIQFSASLTDGLAALGNGQIFNVISTGLSSTQYEITTGLVSGSGSTTSKAVGPGDNTDFCTFVRRGTTNDHLINKWRQGSPASPASIHGFSIDSTYNGGLEFFHSDGSWTALIPAATAGTNKTITIPSLTGTMARLEDFNTSGLYPGFFTTGNFSSFVTMQANFTAVGNNNVIGSISNVAAVLGIVPPTSTSAISGNSGRVFQVASGTILHTGDSGTIARSAQNSFGQMTLTSSSPVTYTIASSNFFPGPPIASTNVTFGNAYNIEAPGLSYFGSLNIGGLSPCLSDGTNCVGRAATGWCSGTATANATLSLFNLGSSTTACTGTIGTTATFIMAGSGTISNLTVSCGAAASNTSSGVFSLIYAPSGTAFSSPTTSSLTVSYGSTTANTVLQDTTHTLAYSPGYQVGVKFTTAAGETTLGNCKASFNY